MSFYSSEDIKNELLEPSVHNSNSTSGRSEFRIKGDILPSLKLLNTGAFGQAGTTTLDFIGVLGNIKHITLFDGRQELTAVRNFNDVMGFKNINKDNHSNSDIDRFLKRHSVGYQSRDANFTNNYGRKDMVKNTITKSFSATDDDKSAQALYFDLRECFKMLQSVPILSDKVFSQLRLVIEYENQNQKYQVATNVVSTHRCPLLAIDRVMNPVIATNLINSISAVSWIEEEHDRVNVPATTNNAVASTQKTSKRVLGFNNKYVGRLRIRKGYQDTSKNVNANAVVEPGPYQSILAKGEVFQLVVNGRALFPRAGLEGNNRRLAHLVDTHGEMNLTPDANHVFHTDFNPSALDANKTGKMDFFGTTLGAEIRELQLEYTRELQIDTTDPGHYNQALTLLITAEVSKVLQVGNGSYRISYSPNPV